jgi:hypothetical protein
MSWTTPCSAIWPKASRSFFAFRQGIADAQSAVVWDTDDVARIGFVCQLPILREEEVRRVERDIFPVRTSLAFMPRINLPEQTRRKAIQSR